MASGFVAALTPGVNAQTLSMSFREVSVLLRAGIRVDDALEQSSGFGPWHYQEALKGLAGFVRSGQPLSQGMRMYGTLFHPVIPAVVQAGENTGDLEFSFALLSEFFEQEANLLRTLKSAMVYPTMVAITAMGAVFVLSFLGFMKNNIAIGILWGFGILAALWFAFRFRWFQQLVRYFSMMLPFFGAIIQQLAVARFCNTFGLLIRAGVPYLEGLQATMPVVQHPAVDRAVQNLYYGVRNGSTVEECVRAQPSFPYIMRSLVGAGEAAGALDEMLLKAGHFLREDAEYKIKNSAKVAGPVMVLIMAAIVCIIAMNFLKGYFNMIFEATGFNDI